MIYENMHKIQIAKTSGNIITDTVHAFWIDASLGLRHRKKNSSSEEWTFPFFNLEYEGGFRDAAVTSASNDLFTVWSQYWPPGNVYYEFRHYDDVPLAPQNLYVEIYTESGETYPKLTWSFNYEPDVFIMTNAFQVSRRYSLSGGAWSAWYIIGYSDGDENKYIDYTIGGLYAEANTAEYKLKVRDYNNHFSDYSSSVSINFSHFNKVNSGIVNYDNKLDQNYPNPFNPTTSINYTIKSSGLVMLKIYDMLGAEVASLVNETKEPGNYSISFNASDFPSGMYVYRLITDNFMDSKKLILLK